jgi:pectinesterase inhibitor-like protein
MASHLLALLLLPALVSSATAAAATVPTSPPAPLVQSTCNATAYYDLCVAVLLVDPSSATADGRGLGAIALAAAAANAAATQAALANTTTAFAQGSGRVPALLRQCADKYGEALVALEEARESVGQELYDDALVNVGAAAEYPAVCRRLFQRRRQAYPAKLARREVALERLCTVATGIITLLLP